MKTTERILTAAKDIWASYNEHPFLRGIQDGTLDREKFRYYLIQDYLYLEEFTKVFSIGIAKAKSQETMQLFSQFVTLLIEQELDIHRGYIGKLAVSREEIDATPRALDNLSYTSYMLRIAYEAGEAEILTAILPCAYSYEVIAKNILRRNPAAADHPFYGEWIKTYAGSYGDINVVLLETIDRLTEHYTEAQLRHLEEIFIACSRYELAFWELGWNMSK